MTSELTKLFPIFTSLTQSNKTQSTNQALKDAITIRSIIKSLIEIQNSVRVLQQTLKIGGESKDEKQVGYQQELSEHLNEINKFLSQFIIKIRELIYIKYSVKNYLESIRQLLEDIKRLTKDSNSPIYPGPFADKKPYQKPGYQSTSPKSPYKQPSHGLSQNRNYQYIKQKVPLMLKSTQSLLSSEILTKDYAQLKDNLFNVIKKLTDLKKENVAYKLDDSKIVDKISQDIAWIEKIMNQMIRALSYQDNLSMIKRASESIHNYLKPFYDLNQNYNNSTYVKIQDLRDLFFNNKLIIEETSFLERIAQNLFIQLKKIKEDKARLQEQLTNQRQITININQKVRQLYTLNQKLNDLTQQKSQQIQKITKQLKTYQEAISQLQKDRHEKIKEKCMEIQELQFQIAKKNKIFTQTKQIYVNEITQLIKTIDFKNISHNQTFLSSETKNIKQHQNIQVEVQKLNDKLSSSIEHFNLKKSMMLSITTNKQFSEIEDSLKQELSINEKQQKREFSTLFLELMTLMQFVLENVNKLTNKKIQLSKEMISETKEFQKIKQQVQKKKEKLRNIKIAEGKLEENIKQKKQQIEDLKKTEEALKKSFFRAINQNIKSTIQFTKLKEQNSNFKIKIDELTLIKTQNQTQINSKKNNLLQLEKQKLQNIKKITELIIEKQSLIHEVATLKTTVQSLTLQNDQLKIKITQLENLNSQSNKNIAEIKSLSELQIIDLTSENKSLSSIAELEKYQNEVNIKQIEELKESLIKLADQKSILQIEVQQLQLQIENRIERQKGLKENINKLKEDFIMSEINFNEKVQKQQETNKKNKQIITTMNELLTVQKARIGVQVAQIEGLKKQIDGLQRENISKNDHIIALEKVQNEKIKLDTKLVELSSELNVLQNKCEQKVRDTEEMNERTRVKLLEQIERIDSKQKSSPNKNKLQLQIFIKKLSDRNISFTDLSETIISIIQKLQKQIQESKQSQKNITQELENLKRETQKRSLEANKSFKHQKEKLQAQMSKNVIIIQDLREQLLIAQMKIAKLERRLNPNMIESSQTLQVIQKWLMINDRFIDMIQSTDISIYDTKIDKEQIYRTLE